MRVTIHHPTRDCSVNYDVERDVISFTLWGEEHEGGRGYTELNLPHLSLKRPYEEVHLPAAAQAASPLTMPSALSASPAIQAYARHRELQRYILVGLAAFVLGMLVLSLLSRHATPTGQSGANHAGAFMTPPLHHSFAPYDQSSSSLTYPSRHLPASDHDISSPPATPPTSGHFRHLGDEEPAQSPAPGFGMP